MNVSELARRLRVHPDELREKLPLLGFDIGRRAIKVDDRLVERIMVKWNEMSKLERLRSKYQQEQQIKEQAIAKVKEVVLPKLITVRDFAAKLSLPLNLVIGELMKNGILASVNERIDFTTASIVAEDMGFKVIAEDEALAKDSSGGMSAEDLKVALGAEEEAKLKPRPPVVVVMGHVDHGKTALLDAIRKTNVMKSEAGGITQHIGAYQVVKKDRKITFIDTPGHEAFTVMRSRGARVADIAILVVAADDGVQPQTVEVIKIIEAAKVPFVVAMNKMDKPDADPQRVMTQLSEKGVIPEVWGGKAILAQVSAKTGKGIDELLDTVLLVADMDKDRIRANPDRRAVGTIIESHIDKGEGAVATVLVQAGTLRRNDILAIGNTDYGRVRAMRTWDNQFLEKAEPGTPVKILGFKIAPQVGDIAEVPEDPKKLTKARKQYSAEKQGAVVTAAPKTEEEAAEKKMLNVVLKTDVLGSLEAIVGTLEKMQAPEVGVAVVSKGLGNINDSDVLAAEAAQGVVLGFNVLSTREADVLARDKKVDIRLYKIIYELFDEVKRRMQTMLPAEITRINMGKLEVLAVFRTDKAGQVVGGRVNEGKLRPNTTAVVFRAGQPIAEGTFLGLQSGKTDVKEVNQGSECGVKIQCKTAIQVGDIIECHIEERKEKKLVLPK
jgi:translation initiation factor IF-2